MARIQETTMNKVSRRTVLQTGCAAVAGLAGFDLCLGDFTKVSGDTVRDRLWLFAVPANTDFRSVQRRSLMTPAEAALFFEIPNLIIVQASSREAEHGRFQSPFAQYAIALRPFKRIAWSVVGSGGFTDPAETREVIQLAKSTPNFTGIMLDDFFHSKPKENQRAVFSVEELRRIHGEVKKGPKKLDIFATFYTSLLDLPLSDYLDMVDVITFWTWESAELARLDTNFDRLGRVAPKARKMLGCYLYDFSKKQPVAIRDMQTQCEWGLKQLKAKKLEGIIFLANTVADLGFESAEWTRDWIKKVGDQKV